MVILGAGTAIGLVLSVGTGSVTASVAAGVLLGVILSELLLVAVPRLLALLRPVAGTIVDVPVAVAPPRVERSVAPPPSFRALAARERHVAGGPKLGLRLRVIDPDVLRRRRPRLATDPVLALALWSTASAARDADADLGLGPALAVSGPA